jgi:hypothetical protein
VPFDTGDSRAGIRRRKATALIDTCPLRVIASGYRVCYRAGAILDTFYCVSVIPCRAEYFARDVYVDDIGSLIESDLARGSDSGTRVLRHLIVRHQKNTAWCHTQGRVCDGTTGRRVNILIWRHDRVHRKIGIGNRQGCGAGSVELPWTVSTWEAQIKCHNTIGPDEHLIVVIAEKAEVEWDLYDLGPDVIRIDRYRGGSAQREKDIWY